MFASSAQVTISKTLRAITKSIFFSNHWPRAWVCIGSSEDAGSDEDTLRVYAQPPGRLIYFPLQIPPEGVLP